MRFLFIGKFFVFSQFSGVMAEMSMSLINSARLTWRPKGIRMFVMLGVYSESGAATKSV